MDPRAELKALTAALRDRVEKTGSAKLGHRTPRAAAVPKTKPPAAAPVPAAALPADGTQGLRLLNERIADCRVCPLGATRQKLVFGVGNPRARVMFVGEGPGYMEDRQGEPFVGPAGQLLDKILASIGLSRAPVEPAWKWVYIANMVKCHPMTDPSHPDARGNDRPPSEAEMAACRPFLMEQVRLIRPLFLVALGATASKALLNTTQAIGGLRGRWNDFVPDGDETLSVRLMPTFHPAALLRDPSRKKDVWEDMKKLRDALDAAVRAA